MNYSLARVHRILRVCVTSSGIRMAHVVSYRLRTFRISANAGTTACFAQSTDLGAITDRVVILSIVVSLENASARERYDPPRPSLREEFRRTCPRSTRSD